VKCIVTVGSFITALYLGAGVVSGQAVPTEVTEPLTIPAVPSRIQARVSLDCFRSPNATEGLVVIDGLQWGWSADLAKMRHGPFDPKAIASVEVLLPAAAVARFGPEAAGGAIIIQMHEGYTMPPSATPITESLPRPAEEQEHEPFAPAARYTIRKMSSCRSFA
jgi:hypothetical protein